MADQPIKLTPLGNLDKDTEYNFIKEGNYVDALDVIKQDDTGQVSGATKPTQRNKHAFSLGEVFAQNKKYRITVPGVAGRYAITILTPSGSSMVDYNGPIDYPEVTDTTAVQFSSLANFQAEGWTSSQTTNVNIFNVLYTTVNGVTAIELELNAYPYYEYNIFSVGPDAVKVECIQESIPTDLQKPLKDLGSYDVLGDLFIASTSQENNPEALSLSVLSAGPIIEISGQQYYTGPVTTISFDSEHNLQVGQAIGITGSNQLFLNGTFIVNNVISSIEIGIVTNTAWISNTNTDYPVTSGFIGSEVITINPIGMGEIGVAEKDNLSETWSYTRLIRSKEFNFTTRNSIDCFAAKDYERTSFYYTDNFNSPGVFYYKGKYIQDGAIEYINSSNPYSYGDINIETGLQSSISPVTIELISSIESGGNLMPGTKYYIIRQKTIDGDESPMSSPFGPVVVYDLDPKNQGVVRSYAVASSSVISETRVKIKISNLDSGSYPLAELIVVESTSGVITSSIIHEFQIPVDGVYEYTHNGFEDYIPISTNEVLSSGIKNFSQVTRAKNISSIDSRNVMSNISTLGDLDLSEWASTFKHTLFKDEIKESTLNQVGEYQSSEITFDNLGLMMNETYRFGARVYLRGQGWTPFYWVDDIKIDTSQTNQANATDNRRIDTFSDYQLTDNMTSSIPGLDIFQEAYNTQDIWPTGFIYPDGTNLVSLSLTPLAAQHPDGSGYTLAETENLGAEIFIGATYGGWYNYFNAAGADQYKSHTKYYVPKVKFSINWDFIIPGGSRRNLLNEALAIEFGIGDVPNNIKASGMAILSSKTQGNHVSASSNGVSSEFIREFDFHPLAFTGAWPILGWEQEQLYSSALPKYPWSGFQNQANSCTREEEVRNVFTFYSPDTEILASESGVLSGGNGLVATSTDVLVLGGYGRHKCITGGTGQFQDGLTDGAPARAIGRNASFNSGVFSVLHPFGPEYADVESIKINNIAFIDDQDGEGSIGPYNYKVWDSIVQGWIFLYGSLIGDNPINPGYLPAVNRPDKAVFELESNIEYGLDPYYDRTDLRKMDQGLHYVQLYSDTTSTYPSKDNTNYLKVGQTTLFENKTPVDDIKLNGGDTSTSLFYYRHKSGFERFLEVENVNPGLLVSGSYTAYLSQSRSNLKSLKVFPRVEDPDTLELVPDRRRVYPFDFYGENGLVTNNLSVNFYTEQHGIMAWTAPDTSSRATSVYNLNVDFGFLSSMSQSLSLAYQESQRFDDLNTQPTRITWSNRKLLGEKLDSYRIFLPASYKDLDFTFGEINDHQDINGELFTLQNRKFQLQHFNSRGSLQTTSGNIDIVIGEANVLNRDGKTLSSYGTSHKWSVVKGASPGGKDVVYWFNQENGLFMRFGADGTVVLSDRAGMRSFSANNTRWTENQYSPSFNFGIRSVWDDRFKEAIWTFIGIRETRGIWTDSGEKYVVGDIVIGNTTNNYPLDNIPDLYVCIENNNSSEGTEPGNGSTESGNKWTAVAKDNPEYYSVFTLAFNELSNGFSTFYSHLPKTYMKWSNKFLSSNPLHRGELYEHRYGYDKWYEYEGVWKESEPFVEGVVNYIPEQSKKFVAIQSLSENVPDKIEFKTKDQESFLVASDFDPEDDAWRSPIKNDILTSSTSDPNDDTVSLLGSYMRVKFKFFNGAYNKMNNMIIKVRARLRRTGS